MIDKKCEWCEIAISEIGPSNCPKAAAEKELKIVMDSFNSSYTFKNAGIYVDANFSKVFEKICAACQNRMK